jgi:hypothetical protein
MLHRSIGRFGKGGICLFGSQSGGSVVGDKEYSTIDVVSLDINYFILEKVRRGNRYVPGEVDTSVHGIYKIVKERKISRRQDIQPLAVAAFSVFIRLVCRDGLM